jgi:hypothetical protein
MRRREFIAGLSGVVAAWPRCLREAGGDRGVANRQLDSIVYLQMRAIRQIVTNVDVGANPQGGKA